LGITWGLFWKIYLYKGGEFSVGDITDNHELIAEPDLNGQQAKAFTLEVLGQVTDSILRVAPPNHPWHQRIGHHLH